MPKNAYELAADVVVVILGGGRGARLDPLTRRRSKPAVPIAGKYRLIDIPISNAINSGMERMFLLTQYNSVSLHRHIHQTYKFDPFSPGIVQILAAQQTLESENWFQGTADAVRQNLRTIMELRGDYVLILSGDHMYRMDYRRMLADHLEHRAQVSLGVIPCSEAETSQFGLVRVDQGGRIVEFREKPQTAAARAGMAVDPGLLRAHEVDATRPYLASMGIYLFDKQALARALDNTLIDFGRDVIPSVVGSMTIQSHFFTGYWRDIGTIRAFFDAHLDLVRPEPPFDFYEQGWPFYTHPRSLPNARVSDTRFLHSILAEGSVVDGCEIEQTIVGVRSRIKNARIRRTLIMGADPSPPPAPAGAPPIGIGDGCEIENAIIDKNARIGRNVRLVNAAGHREAEGPGWAIRDGIVVVPKNAVIAEGTVI
ncbi:MAG: glucose-1-phosphate adenylyltransferase [Planctomycetes bacterium]|nr:glucose-1-phosphate adenylyltransferase [Planctomycetota bacterium]